MAERINYFKELNVYQSVMVIAMEIYNLTKSFPVEKNIT
jgi:hypothetical protein